MTSVEKLTTKFLLAGMIATLAVAGFAEAELNSDITADATCLPAIPATVQFGSYCDGMINLWDFGDNETSDEQNPQHTYNEYGVFTITHSCSVDGEVSESDDHITVASDGWCPTTDCPENSGWCQVSNSTDVEYDNTEHPVMYVSGKGERNTTDTYARDSAGNIISNSKKNEMQSVETAAPSLAPEQPYSESLPVATQPQKPRQTNVTVSPDYLSLFGCVALVIGVGISKWRK